MHVVFVAAEMVPFSKVGGLADVVGSLSGALVRARHKVTAVLPLVAGIDPEAFSLARRLLPMEVALGGRTHRIEIFEGRLASGVEVRLLRSEEMFERDAIYTDDADEPLRWGLLCKAALTLLAQDGEAVDVVHVHDWHTALIPYYLAHGVVHAPNLEQASSILTIHNLHHQGVFGSEMIGALELDRSHFVPDGFEFFGKLNVFKAGLVTADRVTTVSPTYAREVLEPEMGVGLDGVLRALPGGVSGILNGVDVDVWDPSTDMRLEARYDAGDLSGKAACKRALQEDLGLPAGERTPLVGLIARLVPQKGVDLLLNIAPRLLRSDVQLAVLGMGDQGLESGLERLASRYPDKVAFRKAFAERLSHRFYAGCDMLAVPSRFEPCGLAQLIAMRYGTVPVVRHTGGLADTVVDLDRDLETGNGFVFQRVDAVELLGALLRGVASYNSEQEWTGLVRRLLATDVSWDRSARRYLTLYQTP